jgi:hypothetical protein
MCHIWHFCANRWHNCANGPDANGHERAPRPPGRVAVTSGPVRKPPGGPLRPAVTCAVYNGPRILVAPAHPALKYFASGWCTMIADVDCSGCSWNSSLRLTPIRSGRSSSTSPVWYSTSGHAG